MRKDHRKGMRAFVAETINYLISFNLVIKFYGKFNLLCFGLYFQMSELVDRGGKIFMFLFSIILFNSTLGSVLNNAHMAAHQLHFTQLLKQYLTFQAKGNLGLAAIRLGIATEFITRISE